MQFSSSVLLSIYAASTALAATIPYSESQDDVTTYITQYITLTRTYGASSLAPTSSYFASRASSYVASRASSHFISRASSKASSSKSAYATSTAEYGSHKDCDGDDNEDDGDDEDYESDDDDDDDEDDDDDYDNATDEYYSALPQPLLQQNQTLTLCPLLLSLHL
ncbi:unnamed protein product [Ambrosiozyma monospora]|uniref:Unnamed protein product n=1 Tax=Ambrosiozyma monospora TaxID=43982 RepID=A0ACB5TVW9_AMBMO|nr:unnamed protein product [Ambrosiozyma monospora]